jgi:hypothetical protein
VARRSASGVPAEAVAKTITKQLKTEKWWQARHSEAEMYEREPAAPPEKRRLEMPLVVFTATRWVKFDERIADEAWATWKQHRIAMGCRARILLAARRTCRARCESRHSLGCSGCCDRCGSTVAQPPQE